MRLALIYIAAVLTASTLPGAVEVNDKTDIELSVFVPCAAGGAGEMVDLSGPLHTLISMTFSENTVSGFFHFQPEGIIGTGETTGAQYHATGITRQSFKLALQNAQANAAFVNNFRIIGPGPGNNLLIHETFHITTNANGTTTVFHDNFSVDCK